MTSTVVEELRRWDADQLRHLFTARPDLIGAKDLADLATHATRIGSVFDALADLPAAPRQVLEALTLLPEGATVEQLEALDPDVEPGLVAGVVEDLRSRLLVRRSGDGWRPVGPVRQHLPHPLGLGRSVVHCFEHTPYLDLVQLVQQYDGGRPRSGQAAREVLRDLLSDTEALADQLAELPADVLAFLRRADADGPVLRVSGVDPFEGRLPEDPAARGALLLGLVAAVGVGRIELPLEVGLALRRPTVTRWAFRLPELPAVPVSAQQVAAACAGQLSQLLGAVTAVLAKVEARPVPLLASGGVGVKELRGLATGVSEAATVSLVLRLLDELGLVTATRKDLRLTARARSWALEPDAVRWTELVRAWLASTAFPAARPDGPRSLKAALSWDYDRRSPQARHQLVRLLGTTPGQGYDDLRWLELWGRRWPEQRLTSQDSRGHLDDRELRADVLHEGRLLGLVADTAASPLVRAIHAGDDVAEVLAGLGGVGETTVRAQADLTLVCTGRPAQDMQRALDRVATVEQSGQATVWRISEQSLATAYDEGDTPEQVLAVLHAHAVKVPQAMAYLVKDAHRRHGKVRVGTATSYVVVEDDGMLRDALSKKGAKALGLRRIAPGVAVSHVSMTATVQGLRELGLTAVAETAQPAKAAVKRAPAKAVRPLAALPVFDVTALADARARDLMA